VADGVVTPAGIGLGGVAATPIRAARRRPRWSASRGRDDASGGPPRCWRRGHPDRRPPGQLGYRAAMLGQSLLKLHAQHQEGVLA
jgi:xanthine dehydrogenase small subunit